ncbi:helix-turn-helix transcriptional regulator [Enterococcus mundtii]|uniref:helix-turn-helix domain-containing protein n=1 Tax=Enterococcus TaxID=1350 RepID=UPI0025432D61|nr:helix-turn-helix transcriptional regulator [Enterococcus mundtii]MDK4212309.1 helix-turn-helix transcriptional regulator [Enterococcus mundtii]
MSTNKDKEIGQRIKTLRKFNHYTLETLGKKFNPPIGKATISNWENGYNAPSKENLEALSSLLSISKSYLLTGHGILPDLDRLPEAEKQVVIEQMKEEAQKINNGIKAPIIEFSTSLNSKSIEQLTFMNSAIQFVNTETPTTILLVNEILGKITNMSEEEIIALMNYLRSS